MKMLVIAVAVLLGAVQAQASEFQEVDGAELMKYWSNTGRYIIRDVLTGQTGVPNAAVQTTYRPHYLKVFKTCQEGNTIRTLGEIKTCVRFKYGVKDTMECQAKEREGRIILQNDKCVDTKKLVCEEEVMQVAFGKIKGVGQACATWNDPLVWKWKNTAGNNKGNFEDQMPNCSVFKTFTTNARTNFKFEVIDTFNSSGGIYDKSKGGSVVGKISYTIPACGETAK